MIAVACPSVATAQHAFVQIGPLQAVTQTDIPNRIPLVDYDEGPLLPLRWVFVAGASVSSRLSLGVERLSSPPDILGRISHACCGIDYTEREALLAGTAHLALLQRRHLSLEAVGGLGGLRATATKAVLRPRPSDQSETTTFTVVIVGFEAAAQLLPHLFAVPMFRIYALDRHPLQVWSGETPPSPRPSTLAFVGVSARIGW